jgi:hypothetical protein
MLLKTKHVFNLFLILVLLSVAFLACDKNEGPQVDPGYVNISIRPNSTEYIELNSPGGWVYLYANPPSRGIIVYRVNQDEFRAYERTPTYKPDSCCVYEPVTECTRVVVDESGILLNDTCTGSQYIILDGSVTDGPAVYGLYTFNTNYDGETLFIFN